MSRTAALIPAYNEEQRIASTVKAACSIPGVDEIVVIDDGSSDRTADSAREAGAHTVVCLPQNSGKGAALQAGFEATDAEIILMLDADLEQSAALGAELLQPVLEGRADMTVAIFPELTSESTQRGKGGFGLAVKAARGGIQKLSGRQFLAPLSGQRALRREIIAQMGGFPGGFAVETALSGWAAMAGWRVLEVPLDMAHRRTGRDWRGFVHRGRQLAHVIRALIWLHRNSRKARSFDGAAN